MPPKKRQPATPKETTEPGPLLQKIQQLSNTDKNRLVCCHFFATGYTIDQVGAAKAFGSASAASMSKLYGNIMKKLQVEGDAGDAAIGGEISGMESTPSSKTTKPAKESTPKTAKGPKKGGKDTKTTKAAGKRKAPAVKEPAESSDDDENEELDVEEYEDFPPTAKRAKVKKESSEPESNAAGLDGAESVDEEMDILRGLEPEPRKFHPMVRGSDPYEDGEEDDVEMES
ncbi:MAG: hypothetical protein M1831_001550 [Alyxoria varia]|nr:MAG: hypothetical protein M1831_001550 [Alyxoria varia]